MSSDWEQVTLGECISFASGNTPSKAAPRYWGGSTPWISAKDMKSFWVEDSEDHLTPEGVAVASALVPPGTTLLLTRGMTLHNDIPIVRTRRPATFNQDVKALSAKRGIDPDFIAYLLLGHKAKIQSLVDSAGHGTGRLGTEQLKGMPVVRPPLKRQQELSSFFAVLDDRITLLRETNATLEAIAQALFKSWFVDFDPVHAKRQGLAPAGMDEATAALFPDSFEESALGLVPRGWAVQSVGDIVECVGGATPDTKEPSYWSPEEHAWTSPKDLSGLPSPVLLSTERRLSTKGLSKIGSGLLPVGTLLMSSRAPIGYLAIAQLPLAINQGYIAMPPGSLLPPLYMLLLCQQNMDGIKARANGSTFMEISKKAFRPIPVVIPSLPVIEAFVAFAAPLFNRLASNEQQAQTLATLRDTLLPRLISGQLRLPEVLEKVGTV